MAFGSGGLPSGERRQITVVFCDVVDSTHLSQQLDLEEYGEVMRAYQAAGTEVINRHGGYVARYLGDGILSYFGYPQARENDPRRAIQAASCDYRDAAETESSPAKPVIPRCAICRCGCESASTPGWRS